MNKCPHQPKQDCYHGDCNETHCMLQVKEEHRVAAAKLMQERVMQNIEKLDDNAQSRIIECGMRLRELACFYGPYFKWAISMTSAEIASGALIMPTGAECDRTDIMLPGGRRASENVELIIPGRTKH